MLREFQEELVKLREQAAALGSAPKVIEEVKEIGLTDDQIKLKKEKVRLDF